MTVADQTVDSGDAACRPPAFRDADDLVDVCHLLRAEPELAESIRRERYSDGRLIAYLDHALFYSRAGQRAAA